jgi:hypothetical protein
MSDLQLLQFIRDEISEIKSVQRDQGKEISRISQGLSFINGKIAAIGGLTGAFSAFVADKVLG